MTGKVFYEQQVRRNDLNIYLFYNLSVFIYAGFSRVYNFPKNLNPTKTTGTSV